MKPVDSLKILAVSDIEDGLIYSPAIKERYKDVDLVISCGDLPYYYLEYIISMLDVPLYFVLGNHANTIEITSGGERRMPWGAIDIHRKCIRTSNGLLVAGIEGCLRYNYGPHQYTQNAMWMMALGLVPSLLLNRLLYGRYLDILATHAPPWKIHDKDDLPHRGIKAFNWLIRSFKPAYHLHGHIHIYRLDTETITQSYNTQVVNVFGHREINISLPSKSHSGRKAQQ
ncbi:MAG: metallophosphoesterase [Anaerolineaceae bacterium]|jgi:Icc-related predicted phosphoesterase